jgi:high-affinity Fe2+/Pb2+ permease
MYILLALVAAVAIGVGIHFALPRRGLRGVALAPAIAGATAAVVYAICTWTGLGEGNPVTWLVTLAVSFLLCWVGTDALSRLRASRDAATEKRLGLA